jgi:hypothetical protein
VGIEPTTTAWKAVVLPLNYARIFGGFNPLLWNNNISYADLQHVSKNLQGRWEIGGVIHELPLQSNYPYWSGN